MPNWPEPWLRKTGGELPTRYVAFDTETSGFHKEDCIVSIGHVQVCDGEIEHAFSANIDWRGFPWVDQNRLRMGLERVSRELPGYSLTYDHLCSKGLPADQVFSAYHEIFTTLMKKGYYVVAHNPYRFDEPRIAQAMQRLKIDHNFSFGEQLLDSHVLEIASRNSAEAAIAFQAGDTLRSWSKRVMNHSGKFAACRLMEDLVPRYGIVLDFDRAHDADMGAMAVHHVMSHFIQVCRHRNDQLHPTQWDVIGEREPQRPIPTPFHQKPPPPTVQVKPGLKRFRGQRSG